MAIEFTPKLTATENASAATTWLGKALKPEADGKTPKMIELALQRACDFELASLK